MAGVIKNIMGSMAREHHKEESMADTTSTQEMSDMFQTMQQTNKMLLDVLSGKLQNQPTYVQAVQPAATQSPNYLLWAGIAIAVFLLIKKGKLL